MSSDLSADAGLARAGAGDVGACCASGDAASGVSAAVVSLLLSGRVAGPRSMSAAQIEEICKLEFKANEFYRKGHFARSAEKYALAAAAAQGLGHTDCLITAYLQAYDGDAWYFHFEHSRGTPDGEAPGPVVQRLCASLSSACTTLEFRRAEGTLMAGSCRPVEVAWRLAFLRYRRLHLALHGSDDNSLEFEAPFIGYEAYLHMATLALRVYQSLDIVDEHLEAADMRLATFALCAAELFARPRAVKNDIGSRWLLGELKFISRLRKALDGELKPVEPAVIQPLLDAWQLLQDSGMLPLRDMDEATLNKFEPMNQAVGRAMRIARATGPLLACALSCCAAREVHTSQYKKCAACMTVAYCCREHQLADWPAHKKACKVARKAAAGSND